MFGMRVLRKRHRVLPPVPRPGEVRVGFPASTAGAVDSDGASALNKAVWNQYGTRTIPERPFLDNAMRDNREKYRRAMKSAAQKVLLGETAMPTVLNKLGLMAQGDVQRSIRDFSAPPNAPSTIAAKGSSQPLEDTRHMLGAVTYEVRGA